MATVRKFLDLSTVHLPQHVMNSITSFGHATSDEHGAWVWVPPADDDTPEDVPAEILPVWAHARANDCEYIRFDCDGPMDDALPRWEW